MWKSCSLHGWLRWSIYSTIFPSFCSLMILSSWMLPVCLTGRWNNNTWEPGGIAQNIQAARSVQIQPCPTPGKSSWNMLKPLLKLKKWSNAGIPDGCTWIFWCILDAECLLSIYTSYIYHEFIYIYLSLFLFVSERLYHDSSSRINFSVTSSRFFPGVQLQTSK